MIPKEIALAIAVAVCAVSFSQTNAVTSTTPTTTSRLAAPRARKNKGASFDPKTYLAELSAEGRQRGYKEFTYKQTQESELRIYFKMPKG